MKLSKSNNFFSTIMSWFGGLLKFLRARSLVGGLEISDQNIRFTYWTGKTWQLVSLRLPPGVVHSGAVQDQVLFAQALNVLRKQVNLRSESERLNVIFCPSGASVYTQSFSLPALEGDSLERAVDLNIRMISPADLSQVYSGWQILNHDTKDPRTWEVLGGFLAKPIIDGINQGLNQSRFLAVAAESKAIAVSRLMRYWVQGFDSTKPAIVLMLDSTGINLLILRNGQLYFEYVVNWTEVPEASKGVTRAILENVLTRNLNQVVNFFREQWPSEQLNEIWISSNVLQNELSDVIAKNFSLSPKIIRLKGSQNISPEWHVSLGLGLRGQMPRREDREMSLIGIGAREEFAREELTGFLAFWRVLTPLVLAVLIALLVFVNFYLAGISKILGDRVDNQPNNNRVREVDALETRAKEFNQKIAMIKSIQTRSAPKQSLLSDLENILTQNQVVLTHLSFRGWDADIAISGQIASEDDLKNFKKSISSDSNFQAIVLPISEVRPAPGGLTFNATIKLAPRKK